MKATDLMIGDWVLHFGKEARIVGIRIDNYNNSPYYRTNLNDTWYESGVDGIEPIPLTPEILEKNGFSEPVDAGDGTLICGMSFPPYKLTFQSIFGLPVLTIEDVVDDDNIHTCLVLKDEIYSVHELQHALKLCKIDKEIVL